MKLTALLTALLLVLTLSACTADPANTPQTGQPSSQQQISKQPVSETQTGSAATSQTTDAAAQSETLLTRNEAIAIALGAAGLDRSAVRDLEAELDREWGTTVWEVDFDSGALEYSYDLDAQTGTILHQKTERD